MRVFLLCLVTCHTISPPLHHIQIRFKDFVKITNGRQRSHKWKISLFFHTRTISPWQKNKQHKKKRGNKQKPRKKNKEGNRPQHTVCWSTFSSLSHWMGQGLRAKTTIPSLLTFIKVFNLLKGLYCHHTHTVIVAEIPNACTACVLAWRSLNCKIIKLLLTLCQCGG